MKLNYRKIAQTLLDYQQEVQTPVFSELINRLGWTWNEWCAMVLECADDKAVKMLLLYKEHLEIQIEKEMIYQKQGKFYNHGAAQFVLKKLNPLKYGDKVVSMNVDAKASGYKLDGQLKNTSGLNLLEKLNS